ncbi:unnamed protein product [Coregonus sp. 'balchen']|nr:unnamed protein product [Coregonus sp. 'balchen']
MELFRERELRETLEKQLAIEQKNRALEYESKRREQAEQSLKPPSCSEGLRSLNDSLTPETESDRSAGRTDAERTIQALV